MDLQNVISRSQYLSNTLDFLKNYNREQIFIAAGAIAETVWNYLFDNELKYGIEDLDLIFFNNKDLSEKYENDIAKDLNKELKKIDLSLDIKNQARVHLWYEAKFSHKISPIKSLEDSIERFPTTTTSIAIRYDENNQLELIAPYGLDDLFSGIIRPNKKQITEAIYYAKVEKWTKKWPGLKVLEW
jgi:hypothetical protein